MTRKRLEADLLLAFISFVWGSTFVVVKDALAYASPFVFLLLRFCLALAVLLAVAGRRAGLHQAGLAQAGIIIGSFLGAGFSFQTIGLQYTTPAKSAFITGLSVALVPLFPAKSAFITGLSVALVPLFLALFFGRRIHLASAAGVVMVVVGLYFLTIPPERFVINRGDLLTVFCAVCYAGYIIAVGHFTPRFSSAALGISQIGMVVVCMAVAVPLAYGAGWQSPVALWHPRLLFAIVVTGVFASALAFTGQAWAQRHTSPTHTAILFSLEPVFAGLTSYVVYGEHLTGRALLGAVLILAGILVAEFRGPTPTAGEFPVPPPPEPPG